MRKNEKIKIIDLLEKREELQESLLTFTKHFFKTNKKEEFVVKPYIVEIITTLEKVARGEIKRLIINIPPRMGKTQLAVINYIAWVLANNPKAKFIHLSYSNELALKNSASARDLITSVEYQRYFNYNLSNVENAKGNWVIQDHEGGCYATGSGGQITGFGAGDIKASPFCGSIIIDDPLKADDSHSTIERNKVNERFFETIVSRLNNVNVPIIVIMQRLHEDDLSGHLLAVEPKDWHHLKIPAIIDNQSIWEEKYPLDYLHKLQKANPSIFAGQFMQEPAPMDGNIFKSEWVKYHNHSEEFTEIYQSWDTAIKKEQGNDFSVCTTWGVKDNHFYLLDCKKVKLEFPELLKCLKDEYNKHRPRQILIEDKASGSQLLQVLRRETQLPIVAYDVSGKGDKEARFRRITPRFESGRVYFSNRHFVKEVELELKLFPNSKNDDIVDSISNFFNWYEKRTTRFIGVIQ